MMNERKKHKYAALPVAIALAALVGCVPALPAQAHNADTVQAMFHAGAIYGQVVDSKTGKPLANATVALQDRHGHVVAWTRTDDAGHYQLAANSLAALDLEEHHRGVMASIGRGFVEVIKLPVNLAGVAVGVAANTVVGAVKAVDPIGTIKAAAVSAAEGNPMTLAQQAATDVSHLLSPQSQRNVRGNAATAIIDPTHPPKHTDPSAPQPGEAAILVSAPDYKQFQGAAGSYYMIPAPTQQTPKSKGTQAWLNTVQLAPESDPKGTSDTHDQAPVLCNPIVTPAFVATGHPMQISVQMQTPTDPPVQLRVVARVQSTHQAVELLSDGKGTYTGTLWLAPNTPLGPTTLTIAALTANPVDANFDPTAPGNSLLTYASNLDDLDAGKPYRFDPRILGSENRIDVNMMILNPALETPPPTSGG